MSAISMMFIFFKTLAFTAVMMLLSIAPPLWVRSVLEQSRLSENPLSIATSTSITFGTSLFVLLWGGFFRLNTSLPPRPTFFLFQSSSFDPIFSWFYYLVKTSHPSMQGLVRRPLLMSFFVLGYYAWFLLCCYLAHVVEGDGRERWLALPPNWLKPRSWQGVVSDEEDVVEKGFASGSESESESEFERPREHFDSDGSIVKVSPHSPSIV